MALAPQTSPRGCWKPCGFLHLKVQEATLPPTQLVGGWKAPTFWQVVEQIVPIVTEMYDNNTANRGLLRNTEEVKVLLFRVFSTAACQQEEI